VESIKSFITISLSAILAYFQPIHSVLEAITLLFVLNFIFGLFAGVIVNKEKFSFKKAFRCISEVSISLFILASVFFIGDHAGAKGRICSMMPCNRHTKQNGWFTASPAITKIPGYIRSDRYKFRTGFFGLLITIAFFSIIKSGKVKPVFLTILTLGLHSGFATLHVCVHLFFSVHRFLLLICKSMNLKILSQDVLRSRLTKIIVQKSTAAEGLSY